MARPSVVSSVLVLAAVTVAVGLARADDEIPLPVKKPRDATGAVIVNERALADQEKSSSKFNRRSSEAAADKAAPKGRDAEGEAGAKGEAAQQSKSDAGTSDPTKGPAAWPKTVDDSKIEAAEKAAAPPTEWPAADIEAAKARCTQLLKQVDAITIPEPAFRQGDCGAEAPVRLVSIGKDPEVALAPPALVTCDMVATLGDWVKTGLQPAAKRHLGQSIIKIEVMSDYSCRLAYGRSRNKLSEHGRANALDIGSFTTSSGKHAVVLKDWGPTERDIAAQIAAAKAAAAKEAAEKTATAEATAAAETATGASGDAAPALPAGSKSTIVDGLGSPSVKIPASRSADPDAAFGFTPPSQLGGPNSASDSAGGEAPKSGKGRRRSKSAKAQPDAVPGLLAPVPLTNPPTKTALFLKDSHRRACQLFGTTLGPEANNDHRNHFHLDMADRKFKKICD